MIQFFNTTLDDYLIKVSNGEITSLDTEKLFFIEDKGAIYKGLTLIADNTLLNDSFKYLEDKFDMIGTRNYFINAYKYTVNTPYTIMGALYANTHYTELHTGVELPRGKYTITIKTTGTWVPNPPDKNTPMNPNQQYCGLYLYRKNMSGEPVQDVFIDMTKGYANINIETQDVYWLRLDTYSDGIKLSTVYFYDMKIERGLASTDFSPAWEDLEIMPHRWSAIIELPDSLEGYGINDAVKLDTFNAHISNMENPHGVTKGLLGLDKVENFSVTEILSKITSSHIESALGYKPANSTNASLTGKTQIQDITIAGGTLVDAHAGGLYIKNTSGDRTTKSYRIFLGSEDIRNIPGRASSNLEIVSTKNYQGTDHTLTSLMLFDNENEKVFSTNFSPNADKKFSLGESGKRWQSAYIETMIGTAEKANRLLAIEEQAILLPNRDPNRGDTIIPNDISSQIAHAGISFVLHSDSSTGGPKTDDERGYRAGHTLNIRGGKSDADVSTAGGQLFFGFNSINQTDKLFYRSHGSGDNQGWGDWRELAFKDLVVSKSGDSMYGPLRFSNPSSSTEFASTNINQGAINLNGSNISRVNSIYFDKPANFIQGIHFIHSAEYEGDIIKNPTVDTLLAYNGALYFTANHEPNNVGPTFDRANLLLHSSNYTAYAISINGGTISHNNFGPFNIIRTNVDKDAYDRQVTAATIGFGLTYEEEANTNMLGYIGMARTKRKENFDDEEREVFELYKYTQDKTPSLVLDEHNFHLFVSHKDHTHDYIPLAGTTSVNRKVTGDIIFDVPMNDNYLYGLCGQISNNKFWRLSSCDVGVNGGVMLNVSDTQYDRASISVSRTGNGKSTTLHLLDNEGNTIIPKMLKVNGDISGNFGSIFSNGTFHLKNGNFTTIQTTENGNTIIGGSLTSKGLNVINNAGDSLLSVEGGTIKMSATLDLGDAAVQANSFVGETFGTYVGESSGPNAGKVSNFVGTINGVWIKYENGKYYLGTRQANPNA